MCLILQTVKNIETVKTVKNIETVKTVKNCDVTKLISYFSIYNFNLNY